MTKRIFALLLCAATLLTCLTFIGCQDGEKEEDKGQYITTYLTDNIYDLDPANAYNNESVSKIVGLLFDTLFKLDENGNVQKSLVDKYVIKENEENKEYIMQLYLKKDAKWSDGTNVSANDIVFAWQRLLRPENNYEAAALLFDIQNARAAKEGDASIDDVGIYPAEQQMLEIRFEGKINYDHFIMNLTSLALAPLRDEIVSKGEDWAKKAGTMVCSGPFKLGRINMTLGHPDDETARYFDSTAYLEGDNGSAAGDAETNAGAATGPNKYMFAQQKVTDFLLERNTYYYRDIERDSLKKSVTPYKICVDCTLTDAQLTDMYEKGLVMYIGDIPLSMRKEGTIASAAKVAKTSMSTNTIYLNQNALIPNGTDTPEALFANADVRKALSMAIDRQAIADAVVYAEVATGLIPTGLFETTDRGVTFRSKSTDTYAALSTNLEEAKQLLASAGIKNLDKYEIQLTVAAYDDVHCYIAEEIVKAWQALGFTKASVKKLGTIANNDYSKYVDEVPADICDDLYAEELRAVRFQAILVDYVAYSVDPFSMLAPFAKAFSGRGMDMSNLDHYELTPHMTGYDNEDYNKLMEEIFAEKTIANRAPLYHQAEAKLMEDMPVIPVIFNLSATVQHSELRDVKVDYTGIANFQKSSVGGYDKYLDNGFNYLVANYKPTNEQAAAIKDAWKAARPSDAASIDAMDINEMPVKFDESSPAMIEVYKMHPMWNLKIVAAKDCSYMAWNLFHDANSVYGHFFLKEKERIAALEAEAESLAAAESLKAAQG